MDVVDIHMRSLAEKDARARVMSFSNTRIEICSDKLCGCALCVLWCS
jgi:hypothetical protein